MPLWSDCAGLLATRFSAEVSKNHPSVPPCTHRHNRSLFWTEQVHSGKGRACCTNAYHIARSCARSTCTCSYAVSGCCTRGCHLCGRSEQLEVALLVAKIVCADQCCIWPMNQGCLPAMTQWNAQEL